MAWPGGKIIAVRSRALCRFLRQPPDFAVVSDSGKNFAKIALFPLAGAAPPS
jgi:hypothetical protein